MDELTNEACCAYDLIDRCPVEPVDPDPVPDPGPVPGPDPDPKPNLVLVILIIIFAIIIVAIILVALLFWFRNKKNKSNMSSVSTVNQQPPARDSQNDLFESRRDRKANGSDKSPDHAPLDAS